MFLQVQDIQGLKYNEYINLKNSYKLLNNWSDALLQLPEERRNNILEYSKTFDPLNCIKKLCKNNSNINIVSYAPSKNLKNIGRLFAQSVSLQNLPREFRGVIGTNYYDIDMVNAHPSILYQYCKLNDIKCDNLEYYVNNRDEIIKNLCDKYDLTKPDIKQMFLSVMNGGKREGIIDDFFTNFKNECYRIHKFIISLNEKLYKDVCNRKEFNKEGSLTNIILCQIENNLLLHSVQYLLSIGYNVDVLVFDGFMVRKEDDKPITEELLKILSDYVFEKTNYRMKFNEKPLDNSIDLSIYNDDDKTDLEKTITYHKDKEEFEKTHLKIIHPPLYLTIKDDTMELQSKDSLLNSYQHLKTTLKITIAGKEVITKTSFIKTWINDENIRKYEHLSFTPPPLINNPENYNTWRGFSIEKVKLPENYNKDDNEYVKRFIEYISNLVNHREKYIYYIIAWIANMVQYPAIKSTVCIVLYSIIEGVGKSKLIELIEKIIGENLCYDIVDLQNGLFGKHSMAEFERLFISLVEVKGKDTYTNNEAFKSKITESNIVFEPKGLASIKSTNYCNYICSTNNINCISVGEKDRRFLVITCNNKKANDKLYFLKFHNEVVQNPEAIRCIFEYLKTFNIEEHIPDRLFQEHRPLDDALYQDLQEYNKDIVWGFLEYFVKRNINEKIFKVSTKTLWNSYESFLEKNGEKKKLDNDTSKKFHFNFKQKICQVLQNTENHEETVLYSTREKRIRNGAGDDCYLMDIEKLKEYFKFTDIDGIENDEE